MIDNATLFEGVYTYLDLLRRPGFILVNHVQEGTAYFLAIEQCQICATWILDNHMGKTDCTSMHVIFRRPDSHKLTSSQAKSRTRFGAEQTSESLHKRAGNSLTR